MSPTVLHRVQKTRIREWTQLSAIYKIMHCYLALIVVHPLSKFDCLGFNTWIHRSLGVICCFLKFVSVIIIIFFALATFSFFLSFFLSFFFYPLNSLNHVRICASAPYIQMHRAPRDLQKQYRVIARFSYYSTKTMTRSSDFGIYH